jgi:hypothetical protein
MNPQESTRSDRNQMESDGALKALILSLLRRPSALRSNQAPARRRGRGKEAGGATPGSSA